MTGEERKLLEDFETKLRHLVYLHDELKRENARLQGLLAGKEEEIKTLTAQLKTSTDDYTRLKTAATIGKATGQDISETRKRLSGMVREIDKCISLITR